MWHLIAREGQNKTINGSTSRDLGRGAQQGSLWLRHRTLVACHFECRPRSTLGAGASGTLSKKKNATLGIQQHEYVFFEQ